MKRFELRLDTDLFERIERLARAERRTINQQMLWLLGRGFTAEQHKRVLPCEEDGAAGRSWETMKQRREALFSALEELEMLEREEEEGR